MDSLQQTLASLVQRPDVRGAAVASGEGLLVASRLPEGADGEALAALGAHLLRDAGQLAGAVHRESPRRLVLDSGDGLILVSQLGSETALVVLAAEGADAGALLYHLRQQQGAIPDHR